MINPGLYKLIEQYNWLIEQYNWHVRSFSPKLVNSRPLSVCTFVTLILYSHRCTCRQLLMRYRRVASTFTRLRSLSSSVIIRFHKKESFCYPVGLVTCIITEFLLIFSLSHMSCSLTLTVAGMFCLYWRGKTVTGRRCCRRRCCKGQSRRKSCNKAKGRESPMRQCMI